MAGDRDEYRELLRVVERNLADNFALYERLRRLAQQPETVQTRVLELFRRDEGEPRELSLQPYAKVTPHVAFGFEAGFNAALAWRERTAPAGSADAFSRAVEIAAEGGSSQWFAMEIAAPWWEVRRAEALSMVAAARVERDLHASLEMFVWDHEGTRHTVASRAFAIEAAAPTLQQSLTVAIPDHLVLDESHEPKIALFLPRDPYRLTLDYLWLRLHARP